MSSVPGPVALLVTRPPATLDPRERATTTDDERAVLLEALEASRTAQDLASDEGVAQGTADLGGHGDRGVA